MAGCGLPDYVAISKPSVVSTSSATAFAFQAPVIDDNITGYILYYKIYGDHDYSDEISDDISAFDENTYINANDEMPIGRIIPNQQGFFRVGTIGNTEVDQEFTIAHSDVGAGGTVFVDFNPDDPGTGVSDANTRYQPVVGTSDPVTSGTVLATLARGFVDPTDESGYSDGGVTPIHQSDITPGDRLRLFVEDWDFDQDDADDFIDGDLRRGYNQMDRQTADIENVGTVSVFDNGSDGQLRIAIAVSALGRDISNGTFVKLESKPILLLTTTTTVTYSPLYDAVRTGADRTNP